LKYITVDGHCDSILDVANGIRSLSKLTEMGHLDFHRLRGRVNLQFMALFIESIYKPNNSLIRVLELIDLLDREICATGFVGKILTKKELVELPTYNKKILGGSEGGEELEGNISVLRCLFNLGVRSLTLTWNHRNELGDGCGEEPYGNGLSKFGKKVIKEMNSLGMVIDVSHLAERGFWDVIELSKGPIIASHSCCKALVPHKRNLSDKQLKALAEKDGVIGINYYPQFLNSHPEQATIDDVVKHIIHVSEVIGSQYVGLGSDFDGINKTPVGLEDVTKIDTLLDKLVKAGFSSEDIANIMGNSFLKVLKKVLPDG